MDHDVRRQGSGQSPHSVSDALVYLDQRNCGNNVVGRHVSYFTDA